MLSVIITACVSFEKIFFKFIKIPFAPTELPCILPVSMATQRWWLSWWRTAVRLVQRTLKMPHL